MKIKILSIILFSICLVHKTNAQSPYMIKDVATSGTVVSTNIGSIIKINDILFFTADDGIHGIELWKSDGTASGTVMVKDINIGLSSSFPASLRNVNGLLCFRADDGENGYELWKSDGTESGTVMVKDIYPGSGESTPVDLIVYNSVLYFNATDDIHGKELWKSDGTASGTVLVKDIYEGSRNGGVIDITEFNNAIYFNADDGINGRELWKSDGTESGTILVKDLSIGGHGNPFLFTVVNDVLYFMATNELNGEELWKSDGTESGTILVKDIVPGEGDSDPRNLSNANGTFYFSALDDVNERVLWKSDGTESGTILVKNIIVGSRVADRTLPPITYVINSSILFEANDGIHGNELWKSDGTTSGTVLVKDIRTGSSASSPSEFTNVNGTLYFRANDGVNGPELWKSDGTEVGTVLVKDMVEGFDSSNPSSFTNINDKLYFSVSTLLSKSGSTYKNVLMALGNCSVNNNKFNNNQTIENMAYNSEVQSMPNNAQTCHCNIYNELISTTEAMGINPVGNINNNRVYIDAVATSAYVKRHYEIVPDADFETATGKVTLYFTQQEFDEYNSFQTELLPTDPTNISNKNNLKIELITGSSSDGSGDKSSYTGESIFINPEDSDIVWNATDNRWEITFETTGFGGFWLISNSSILSIKNNINDNVVLSPNPSDSETLIRGLNQEQDYNIYSLLGKKVSSGRISNNTSIDISQLQTGIYILNLESGAVKKIIKK